MLYQRDLTKDKSKMKIERLKEHWRPPIFEYVTVKEMGDITQVRFMTNDMGGVVRKIDKNTYKNLITGEIKEYQKNSETRADNVNNVRKSMTNLRDIINTNITDQNIKQWLFITLTYKENMTDPKRLYNDLRKFRMRLQTYLNKMDILNFEDITCIEPQERGAFHAHSLIGFTDLKKAPFIENSVLREIWGFGFVNIRSLKRNRQCTECILQHI